MLDKNYTHAFARETIQLFQESIRKKRVGKTQMLVQSFKHEIETFSGGNTTKLKILYNYYGRFPNLGVGKGQSLAEVKDNATLSQLAGTKQSRRPKRWKDQVWKEQRQKFYGEVFFQFRARARAEFKLKQDVNMNM